MKEIKWDRMVLKRLLLLAACGVMLQGIFYTNQTAFARKSIQAENTIQQGIAKEIVRFHVLANSDSEQDQELKMAVKERIVHYMQEILADAGSVQQAKEKIKDNLENIRKEAMQEIHRQGYSYPVEARLETCYFPMKSYGDCTFPAGDYEALRICIGEAKGHNWWCVLYPNLCFVDSLHAVVPEEEKQELRNVLTEEEYDSLFDWQEDDYEVKSGFWELCERIF